MKSPIFVIAALVAAIHAVKPAGSSEGRNHRCGTFVHGMGRRDERGQDGGRGMVSREGLIAIYMMASQKNGTIYTGVTADLAQRAYKHRRVSDAKSLITPLTGTKEEHIKREPCPEESVFARHGSTASLDR